MTLLGELTLAFLIESVGLAAFWAALGAATGYLIGALLGRRPTSAARLRAPAVAGLAGAMALASLALRLGAPYALLIGIGRREVPLVWSVGGAIVGAGAYWLAVVRRREPVAA